ncbi:GL14458 [Drosophila persimilis]|uniref:GL14458 n=1 Tax=Drosophila persimilis TaxID=7234 RepID=B4GU09_DROPE|nr:GL14458 [Drosophila persimilis]
MAPVEGTYDYDLDCDWRRLSGSGCAKEAVQNGARVACLGLRKTTPIGTKWGVGGTASMLAAFPRS